MAMMTQLPELNAFKDIPGYKAILKAVIRSQIQFLVSVFHGKQLCLLSLQEELLHYS